MIRNFSFDRNVERLIARPLGEQEFRGWRIESLSEQLRLLMNHAS